MGHRLYIHGDIDTESYSKFSTELAELENKLSANYKDYIDVELVSDGGSAYDAIAFHDRIRNSRLDIRITGSGLVASAAVLILAAGDYRILTKNSWVMVHEDSVLGVEEKEVHQVEKQVAHFRRLEDQWCELLAERSTEISEMWTTLHRAETYMTPGDCLEYGLIEEII